jgi:hypothetical protein
VYSAVICYWVDERLRLPVQTRLVVTVAAPPTGNAVAVASSPASGARRPPGGNGTSASSGRVDAITRWSVSLRTASGRRQWSARTRGR